MKESQSFSDIITSKSTQPQSFPGIYRIYECIIISLEMLVGKKKSDHLMRMVSLSQQLCFQSKRAKRKIAIASSDCVAYEINCSLFQCTFASGKVCSKIIALPPPSRHSLRFWVDAMRIRQKIEKCNF